MAQSWFKRNFGWIGDDLKQLAHQLQQPETWILLAIATVFAVLIYFGFYFALKMDFMMRLRNMSTSFCQEVDNSATALLFFGATFLALTITMVFGEFARYLDYKRRRALNHARAAAVQCATWCAFALAIGLALVIFLQSQCI